MSDPVLHFETAIGGRTLCGVFLPTAGYSTGDPATFEESSAKCKRCHHSYYKANPPEPLTDITGGDT